MSANIPSQASTGKPVSLKTPGKVQQNNTKQDVPESAKESLDLLEVKGIGESAEDVAGVKKMARLGADQESYKSKAVARSMSVQASLHTTPAIAEEHEAAECSGGALLRGSCFSTTSHGWHKAPDSPIRRRRSTSVCGLPKMSPNLNHGAITENSAVNPNENQFQKQVSSSSLHSAEGTAMYSGCNVQFSVAEPSTDAGTDTSLLRRRPSRDFKRRSSLILVGSNYRVGRKIGVGNFGEIRLGKNLASDEIVAIKLEPMQVRLSMLHREFIIYKKLGLPPEEGIPAIFTWSTYLGYSALVMELLGPNLAELFALCNRKFTLKTVLLITLQTLRRLQFVHSKSVLYRDIKPENFVIGRLINKQHIIYMIDFGLAKEYINSKTQEHIPYKENKGITGTARYISINMHQGKEASRRDDLEALGYMLIYFLKGQLPWQGQHLGGDIDTLKAVGEIKMRTSIEELCQGCPREFSEYLHYVRSLEFYDPPDYDFLTKLFVDLLSVENIQCDWIYDWNDHRLHVTPSGLLVTKAPDKRSERVEDSLLEQVSRLHSNMLLMSWNNLRDLTQSIADEKGASEWNIKQKISLTSSPGVAALAQPQSLSTIATARDKSKMPVVASAGTLRQVQTKPETPIRKLGKTESGTALHSSTPRRVSFSDTEERLVFHRTLALRKNSSAVQKCIFCRCFGCCFFHRVIRKRTRPMDRET